MFLKIEAGLSILALGLAFTVPNLGSRWFEAIERSFGKLAQRHGLSVAVVGLSALALRLALLPILPIPHPLVSDEFAQLLTADTFAHGRLTNPTPAMWKHFESLMVLLKPTYTSKYPPGQPIFLAAGQVLLGHPFWGVLLSVALMCAAITWMLQAWVGEGWALLGGFLAAIRLGTFSYWANGYRGGAVAALGGALVLGALPRLKQGHRVRNALVMGIGLAILASSRPYEGLILSLPVAASLFVWMLGRHRPAFSLSLRQVVLPLCIVMGLTAAWFGYYNWRITGNALTMPYWIYEKQYDPTPYFLWEAERPLPNYRHAHIEEWERDVELHQFKASRTLPGFLDAQISKALVAWLFYVGPLFSLILIVTLASLPYHFSWNDISGPSRFLLLTFGVCVAGVIPEVFFNPHYVAPMACLFLALILLALRRLRKSRWRHKPSGRFLVRSVPVITLILFSVRAIAAPLHFSVESGFTPWGTFSDQAATVGRSVILSMVRAYPGRDLVLVRYSPTLYRMDLHPSGDWPPFAISEWVYNGPNIDDQRVVWAQDMGPAENAEIIRYYKNRHVWLFYADKQPPELVRYPKTAGRSSMKGSPKTP